MRGGRVIADWPGLSSRALYQGRDLMPTQDMRSVLKGVLEEHLLVPARALDTTVFPDSGAAKALSGLVRTDGPPMATSERSARAVAPARVTA